MKIMSAIFVKLVILQSLAFGQEIKGPVTGETKSQIIFSITNTSNEAKIVCSPINDSWYKTKGWDNEKYLIFFPKKDGKYTFTLLDVVSGKTILLQHEITIGESPEPNPNPKPVPVPVTPGKFTERLLPLYKVSPDPAAKKELADIYLAMADTAKNYPTYKAASDKLREHCAVYFNANQISRVRTEVMKILGEQFKFEDKLDVTAFEDFFHELAKSVKAIPD